MADINRRMTGLNPAHIVGLLRLYVRTAAAAAPSTPLPSRNLTSLADKLVSHLQASGIHVQPGLSDADFAHVEAEFGFSFPPDLRSGLPVAAGFPDWSFSISPSPLSPSS